MILPGIVDLNKTRNPLALVTLPDPEPKVDQILIKVSACGVCHTELDEIEGRTMPAIFPIIPGHQVVGQVLQRGNKVTRFQIGDRVGVGWIYSACGQCKFCLRGNENLCEDFMATGRDAHGGYAEYMTAPADFAYRIPDYLSDAQAAPCLCAGGVGYRSLKLTNIRDGQDLGLTGFGASGHLVLKLVRQQYPNTKIYVFTRSEEQREFALSLGASWAGDIEDNSPVKLQAIIDTTPGWKPVVEAMKNLDKGGRLVINAIRKENSDREYLLNLDYQKHLWLEKELKSVANVTRSDIEEFLKLAEKIEIKPEIEIYSLHEANEAIVSLKEGKIRGAKVIVF
jgi:propanol-preferring alcohol dehydrogenase